MKLIRFFLLSLAPLFLFGCANVQPNLPLGDAFWHQPKQKVIVATTVAPKPELHRITGSEGLLAMAINDAMTGSADNAVRHMDMGWYQQFPVKFANQLKQHRVNATVSTQHINADSSNYAVLTNGSGADQLLLIKLEQVGAARFYNGVVPNGAPTGYCVMTGSLIDVSTNKVLWRYRSVVSQEVKGDWDQPNAYPSLLHAAYEAVNAAQEELLDSFFSGH